MNSIDFDFNNMYNIASQKNKNKINLYIEQWKDQGFINGYFEMLANNIYKRNRVKNSEILLLLIYEAYIEEQTRLESKELDIFNKDANYYYIQGQKETENKPTKISNKLFTDLINTVLIMGFTFKEYKDSIIKYNAEQIYKQIVQDISQSKQLDIKDDIYQNIIKKQQNAKLSINKDKISGSIDSFLISVNNKSKLEGIYSYDNNAKVKFISIHDNKTTKMCTSLDGQVFDVHDWNEFYRYSEINGRKTKYKCFGLIPRTQLTTNK